MSKIGTDINYDIALVGNVFSCQFCGHPLLMFGCNNSECENHYKKNISLERESEGTE